MENEEVIRTGKDELTKEIESLNNLTKKSFEELINEKIEADANFKLDTLTEEEKSKLSKEDIESYEIGKKIIEDENKELDPFELIPEYLLDDADKEVLVKAKEGSITEKQLNMFKDTLRQQYSLLALNIYNHLKEEKFKEDIGNIQKETSVNDVVNYYFESMNKGYGFNPEDQSINVDEDKKENAIAFANTILMTNMINLSNNKVFLSRLKKQSGDYRYKKHVENLNYLLFKRLKTNIKSSTTTVNQLEDIIKRTFFKKFNIKIHTVNDKYNGAIAKAYIIAMDELAKKAFNNKSIFTEIYFYNTNIVMLAQSTNYESLTGSAKLIYEHVLEFISNIYEYLLYDFIMENKKSNLR